MPRSAQTKTKSNGSSNLKRAKELVENAKAKVRTKSGVAPVVTRRKKPGMAAKIMIRRLQKTTNPLLKKRPFTRMVKFETRTHGKTWMPEFDTHSIRFSRSALEGLQSVIEELMTKVNAAAHRDVVEHGGKRVRGKNVLYVMSLLYPKLELLVDDKENDSD